MHWDAIVLGLGAVGSAAARALARRGLRVLGLERFGVAHDRGSSHGESRVIRKAYFEHPDYVPLLVRAYEEWSELEEESGERLFERTGVLFAGPPDGAVVAGTRRAAELHGLPIEVLGEDEARRRFPWIVLGEGHVGVFEADAGLLRVEACVRACVRGAEQRGAELRFGARVDGWTAEGGGVTVDVDGERHRAEHLLVAAGAWAPKVLPALAPVLRVQRQPLLWLRSSDPTFSLEGGAPTWGVETEAGFFYGFPALSPGVVKLARHGGGATADPDALDRTLHEEDVEPVRAFAARHLSGVGPEVERHATCMYTMTPDGNFVLGRAHPRVVYAAGLSGHGFKMATALGSALCELALDGRTRERVEFLSPDRPALRSSAPAPTSR